MEADVLDPDPHAGFIDPDPPYDPELSDPSGGVAQLWRAVSMPPFTGRPRFGLHGTLLHPAYGHRLGEARDASSALGGAGAFVADHLEVITGRGPPRRDVASLALGAGPL